MRRWTTYLIAAGVLCLGIGFGAGFAVDRWLIFHGTLPTEPSEARDAFGVFWEAWRLVQDRYVDPTAATPENLTHGAISGMLDALGDGGHTRFLSADDRRAEQDSLLGQLEGIGIEVEIRDGHVTVVSPLDGSPAQKAGILPGDAVEKVNGQDVSHAGLDEVSRLIRGPRGTTVQLTVLRPGAAELLDFTLTRQEVKVPDVTWTTVPGERIAHIRISSFGENTDNQLRSAVSDVRKAGDTRVVLDLRNDPGGLLDQAIQVTSEFVPTGDVLLEQDRSGHREPFAVKSGGVATGDPVVVLINHGTASAAEIVAGAMQDHHRGTIIGEQTFGTGTVLNEFGLSDGSAVLLGVREWLTPSGRSIRSNGITPDRVIAEPVSVSPVVPLAERSMSPDQLRATQDLQLLAAIDALR
jgi:carboxyl-terminal processing protease